jgi:nicotinamide-nucleotide amidase
MPTAEIIAIGTELLLGETTDTNTRYIARVLRDLGVDLYRTQTVGDNAARIAQSVRESLKRTDFVITTGGLGPTVDDPTRQAIAEAGGTGLEFHPELWEQIIARISRYGRQPTENQKRQAYIPRGAIVIENPVGTAPAFIMEMPTVPSEEKKVVISLPGVPREMETLLNDTVIPYLQERYNLKDLIKVRTLHVSGLGEGVIDDLISDLEFLANPTVGLTAHSGVVDIRIAAKAAAVPEADRMIAEVESDLLARLGDNVFGTDDDTLESVTLAAVGKRGWLLATAEYGLEGSLLGRLSRFHHPSYQGGKAFEELEQPFPLQAERVRVETNATALLGLALTLPDQGPEMQMLLITPENREERRLTYGGHPKNAVRWAVNNALDWLRRSALKTG